MRGVNKVILVGTLGKDPEIKTFPNGGSLAQFSMATSDSWTDKNTGERKEQTEWHRVVFNNKQAELVQQFLRKGSKVYVEGSLRTRQWTDQSGQERYTTEIRGEVFQSLDPRPQGQEGGWNNNQGGQQGGGWNNNQGGQGGGWNNNQGGQGGYGNAPQGQGGYGNAPQGQGGYGNAPQGQGGYGNAPQGQGSYNKAPQGAAKPNNKPAPAPTAPPADLDDDLPF